MRIAILGGSFNPIHIGHLFLADVVLSALRYDRVILIPARQSPFKPEAEGAPPLARLRMAAASITGDHRLTIDDCEINREGVSYTIDTIAEIKKRYRPEGKPGLILGDDLIADFHKWKDSSAIAEESNIIIARRLTGKNDSPNNLGFPYPCTTLCNETINISSSMVREKIRSNENWHYLVPAGARLIIEENELYGYRNPFPSVSMQESIFMIENEARRNLDFKRFIHSRNTALMARDLCIRYGLNPEAGYLAGIAHDMCKNMNGNDLIKLAKAGGREITPVEKNKPELLHGKAAAVVLKEKYKIHDKDIINAVGSHVTCELEMGDLAKVLFIADKLEISRYWVPQKLREICGVEGLNAVFDAVLEDTVIYLKSRRKKVSHNAEKLLSDIQKRKKNEKK